MDIAKEVIACVHHEDDYYCLQIELGNDHAITVTLHKDEEPALTFWRGGGEIAWGNIAFGLTDENDFREFVAAAFEPRG